MSTKQPKAASPTRAAKAGPKADSKDVIDSLRTQLAAVTVERDKLQQKFNLLQNEYWAYQRGVNDAAGK